MCGLLQEGHKSNIFQEKDCQEKWKGKLLVWGKASVVIIQSFFIPLSFVKEKSVFGG